MDPIRRLLLLTLVASVLLAEPSQACALLSQRGTPLERDQAIPSLDLLLAEVAKIKTLWERATTRKRSDEGRR